MKVRYQKILSMKVQCEILENEWKSIYLKSTERYAKGLKGFQTFLNGSHKLEFEAQRNRV